MNTLCVSSMRIHVSVMMMMIIIVTSASRAITHFSKLTLETITCLASLLEEQDHYQEGSFVKGWEHRHISCRIVDPKPKSRTHQVFKPRFLETLRWLMTEAAWSFELEVGHKDVLHKSRMFHPEEGTTPWRLHPSVLFWFRERRFPHTAFASEFWCWSEGSR